MDAMQTMARPGHSVSQSTEGRRMIARQRGEQRAATTFLMAVSLIGLISTSQARASWIWVEGERPVKAAMNRHPFWYDQVKTDQLSGGGFISNWNESKAGEALYRVTAPEAGDYDFWVRANPVQARLAYKINDGPLSPIDLEKNQEGNTNIAADGKVDLRFIAWVRVGKVSLKKGANTVLFRMDSKNNNHGYLDCFVLANEPFSPRGIARPDEQS